MTQTDGADSPHDRNPDEAPLSPEIREHLARKLRAEYSLASEKPAFLGDDAVPAQFEPYVRQLRNQERAGDVGLDAIRREFGVDDDQAG